MRAIVENRLSRGTAFVDHIDLCLGCRACETACPSGVPYGHLLEAARAEVDEIQRHKRSLRHLLIRLALNHLFTRPRLLAAVMAAARLVRDSGLAEIAFQSGFVTGRIKMTLALLLASRPTFGKTLDVQPVPGRNGTSKNRVAVLHGCVMDGLFGQTNRATERVLGRFGCEVVAAPGERCCGALHAHAGQIETAKDLARKNIDAFSSTECDYIIVNAAGCGAAMKEYGHLLADDPRYAAPAREFSSKVRDISEFLAQTDSCPEPAHRVARRIAYDAPCHLLHAQRIARAPLDLLARISGAAVAQLKGSETCCGGAGIYNLLHPELSSRILSEKINSICDSGADTVATGNPGCIMQIGAGLLMRGIKVDVVHPVDLLEAAYARE